jgi:hypothetical protein
VEFRTGNRVSPLTPRLITVEERPAVLTALGGVFEDYARRELMTREKKSLFHQRKKGEPIKYNGSVEPIPLPPELKWNDAPLSPRTLTLEIKASPQDWNTLHILAEASPEHLGKLILFYIARPVYEKFLKREGVNLPRGLHNLTKHLFMDDIRSYATAAYAVISHWGNHPPTAWPAFLKSLVQMAEKKLGEELIWPPPPEIEKILGKECDWTPPQKNKSQRSLNVIEVVKYLVTSNYGLRGEEYGFASVEHMDNDIFYKIYIDKNKLKAAKDLIREYGKAMTIHVLYNIMPKFGWEYERVI